MFSSRSFAISSSFDCILSANQSRRFKGLTNRSSTTNSAIASKLDRRSNRERRTKRSREVGGSRGSGLWWTFVVAGATTVKR